MAELRIGIIMNGVTGRMGSRQHLARSVIAIRDAGGIDLGDGRTLVPDPILVGRNAEKLRALSEAYKVPRWSTDLNAALANPNDSVYFDAVSTNLRHDNIRRAITAEKHIYCEQPIATDLDKALALARAASEAGVKHGVVQAKLFLPGMRKLRRLVDADFFGRILSIRLNFGYWGFEGDWHPSNRPSWTYRKTDGGGLVSDMYPHWRYVLNDIVGPVRSVLCHTEIHIPLRRDEQGNDFAPDVEDAAYSLFTFDGGVAQFNTSWATRPYRDEIAEWQVDGTLGSAIVGLQDCRVQSRVNTPKPVWDPDVPNPIDLRAAWAAVPDNEVLDNAFRVQWVKFLRHVALDEPFPWGLTEGAKGVQLAELAEESARERRWVDVPAIV